MFSWKKFCAFPSQVYFLPKDVFSKCWHRHLRGSRDLFYAQPRCADLYKNFSRFSLWILQFSSSISVIFLKIKRVKNLWISVSTITRYSQNLREEIRNCKQEQYNIKVFANRINCLNQLLLTLWILEGEESIQIMLLK